MAQYKVPQDVEADDKLLGPFSFRQFVYLMIAGGLIALMVGLFQLFPVLAIIPLPFALLFGVLALPLRKDQPMETYLVAIVSYYLKPKSQIWKAGQKESTIEITAPKIVEEERTRNLTGEEATHRLSFLADIVDTGGQAIKGMGYDQVNEELRQEAENTYDMFEQAGIDNTIRQGETERYNNTVQEMQRQIQQNMQQNAMTAEAMEMERLRRMQEIEKARLTEAARKAEEIRKAETLMKNPSIIELANNNDYSVATIEKEAKRIKDKTEGEVFISLR